MKPAEAKKLIKNKLDELGLSYTKLTARTVSFVDLTRESCIFVQVHGWRPDPSWDILTKLAKDNGFRIEAPGVF